MAWMISFTHTHLYFSTVDQQHAGLGGGDSWIRGTYTNA